MRKKTILCIDDYAPMVLMTGLRIGQRHVGNFPQKSRW